MEVCSILVSLTLSQIVGGDPQSTAVLLPSKIFKAVGTMPFYNVLLPISINLATPDPSGQWMAICSDMPDRVVILSVVSTVHG